MELTKELLKEKYNHYNEKYFNNELKSCNFSIYNTNAELGRFTSRNGNTKPRIWIAKKPLNVNLKNWTEELLEKTLVHEMIHLYVSDNLKINTIFSPHGIHFRNKKNEIEKKYGLKINIGNFIKKYTIIKEKKSPTVIERLETLYLKPINYLLSWLF